MKSQEDARSPFSQPLFGAGYLPHATLFHSLPAPVSKHSHLPFLPKRHSAQGLSQNNLDLSPMQLSLPARGASCSPCTERTAAPCHCCSLSLHSHSLCSGTFRHCTCSCHFHPPSAQLQAPPIGAVVTSSHHSPFGSFRVVFVSPLKRKAWLAWGTGLGYPISAGLCRQSSRTVREASMLEGSL